jgi:hypothetical protein
VNPWHQPEPAPAPAPIPEPAPDQGVIVVEPGEQCPAQTEAVCAEPEVKVVERIIERTYEKLVEVPVAKGKLVLGSEEYFIVEPGSVRLRSLIDSGAPISTLSTEDLTLFERDGGQWVRFRLPRSQASADPLQVELPVKRFARVSSQRRPVVELSLTVGDVTHMVDVNLTDRSDPEYSLLVGRNFLKDAAVIDVSRRYVQGEPRRPVQK